MPRRRRHFTFALAFLFVVAEISFCQEHAAQETETNFSAGNSVAPPLDTESNVQQRFVAVHGRRSLVAGYASHGLEIWAYPFQIVTGYRVSFREDGATKSIRGEDVLRRIIYAPDSITRLYIGHDFVVHEKIFVPLDEPGAIFTYQVQGSRHINIDIDAMPVLDLMWPAATGGQSVVWDNALSAFVISESMFGYTAAMGSPDVIAHDSVDNRTVGSASDSGIAFTLQPGNSGIARAFVALNPPHSSDRGALLRSLIRNRDRLEADAAAHYAQLGTHVLNIETPDPQVNQALAWSQSALDQAWVCNPQLGCGLVAGYGPSRMGRRPQYDWFFAGDGLVASDALVSEGDYLRAREELAFILRWQDSRTGMIWHELSQSAGFVDWAGKYPYMYAHVDITFQFLTALEHYVTASGDIAFLREHWAAIEAANAYCRSLIDSTDGLPRIPENRMAGDEQDRESDDLGLSVSWVSAEQSFSHLAALANHPSEAADAMKASQLARAAIAERYWNAKQSFWVQGHTSAEQQLPERRSSPAGALALNVFSSQESAMILDQLASTAFETDWGTRTVGEGSTGYDPESYAKGSVFALGTADAALAFWSAHRPSTALQVWSSLLPWLSLDSLGHMHEVLSGNLYRSQIESVPEQTWSSSGFLNSAIHGLLGLEVDAIGRRVVFAPHMPDDWRHLSITNVRLSDGPVGLSLHRVSDGFNLEITNPVAPFHLEFAPEIPLGSVLGRSEMNHRPIQALLQSYPQDQHARMNLDVPRGTSAIHISFSKGVAVTVLPSDPKIGASSDGLHIMSVTLENNILTIAAEIPRGRKEHVGLRTAWKAANAQNAILRKIEDESYELILDGGNPAEDNTSHYLRITAKVRFLPSR